MTANSFLLMFGCSAAELLSVRERQVLDGLYVRNLSYGEMAAELGVAKGTVWEYRRRAISKLQAAVVARQSDDYT